MKSHQLALVGAAVAVALALSALGYSLSLSPTGSSATTGTIEVAATAQVNGAPDTLSLQLSVTTNASSAATALNRNDQEMAHLQQILRNGGIGSASQQTTGLSVGPTYDAAGKINGYQASDNLNATSHQLSRAGKLIDAVENAVGNDVQIQSLSFSISNDGSLLRRARVLAMQLAHTKAADFARGAGEELGSVQSISPVATTVPLPFNALSRAPTASPAHAPVPLQPGIQQVTVQVDVVYRLVP